MTDRDELLRQEIGRYESFRSHLLRKLKSARTTISSLASRMVREMEVAGKLIDAVQQALLSADAVKHPEIEYSDPRGYWISRNAYQRLNEALRFAEEEEDDG